MQTAANAVVQARCPRQSALRCWRWRA